MEEETGLKSRTFYNARNCALAKEWPSPALTGETEIRTVIAASLGVDLVSGVIAPRRDGGRVCGRSIAVVVARAQKNPLIILSRSLMFR